MNQRESMVRVMRAWLACYWINDTECPLPNEFVEMYGMTSLFAGEYAISIFKQAAKLGNYDEDEIQGYHDEMENIYLLALSILN